MGDYGDGFRAIFMLLKLGAALIVILLGVITYLVLK